MLRIAVLVWPHDAVHKINRSLEGNMLLGSKLPVSVERFHRPASPDPDARAFFRIVFEKTFIEDREHGVLRRDFAIENGEAAVEIIHIESPIKSQVLA